MWLSKKSKLIAYYDSTMLLWTVLKDKKNLRTKFKVREKKEDEKGQIYSDLR